MTGATMREIERIAKETGRIFIVTADPEGWPHVAVAGMVQVIQENLVAVTGWFCAVTEANLARNPRAAIIVWNGASDSGYQVIGWREREAEIAIMDGYVPGLEDSEFPQVERELRLRVERVLEFRHARHTDAERAPL